MMKNGFYIVSLLFILFLSSCKEDNINVFEKTADERAAEAIASLRNDLVAPANGWKLKYRPVAEGGAYFVLLNFDENGKVTIRTDLGENNGEYSEQTIGYRIDNSLGLELIFENYSFFSYLFELDQATFGAEYEFNFETKNSDNSLVFSSKTDIIDPTIIVLEEASASDTDLLGFEIGENLYVLSNDMSKRFSTSQRLTYLDKDLVFFVSLNESKRVIDVSYAANKSDLQNAQAVNFTSGYFIQGDSIVFDSPLQGFILGNLISIKSIWLDVLSDTSIDVCIDPIPIHTYSGVTSQNDAVTLETTLIDINGAAFADLSDFYFSPLNFIVNADGQSAESTIVQDVSGALEMHLYYGYPLGDGSILYGIGFVIQNNDGSITFALREFTPVLNGNQIIFNFEPDYTLFGNEQTDANVENTNIYLDALTQGDQTYVYEFTEGIYEFHNPCTGWSFVFVDANQ